MKNIKRLYLQPYTGTLYYARTRKAYEKYHVKLFKESDELTTAQAGRVMMGCGQDDKWTYLVWASDSATLAHELSHVILHVFERVGIDPREAGGEPFCYMLSQLMTDARAK